MTHSRDFKHKQQDTTAYPYSQYSADLPYQPSQQRMESKLDEILRRLTALEKAHGWCQGHPVDYDFYNHLSVCSVCGKPARPGMLSTEANSKGGT